MEKAAGQGHVYAMLLLGQMHCERKDYEPALGWFRMAAEAGLPEAMFNLACCLDAGEGMAAPAGADTRPLFGLLKRVLLDGGCVKGLFRGCSGGV